MQSHLFCNQEGLSDHQLRIPWLPPAPELQSRATLQLSTQSTAGGLQEYEARWFFQQLIVALDYCHRLGVVSRDVSCRTSQPFCVDAAVLPSCMLSISENMLADLPLVCCR